MTTATATPSRVDKVSTLLKTTDERIATRRAELTKARAERKDELDLPRTLTTRQVNDYLAETTTLDKQIAAFNTIVETWAALPTLDADTKWRDFEIASRATLNAELLSLKPAMRQRATQELAQKIAFSIELIDFGWAANRLPAPIIDLSHTRLGEMMAAAGYDVIGLDLLRGPNGFRGGLPETEQRIKTLTKQRTDAQAALDVLLRSDEEKAQQDAEDKVFREVLNAMRIKHGSDGRSLVALTADGEVLDVTDMTPAQRAAFARFEAAHFRRPRETVTV